MIFILEMFFFFVIKKKKSFPFLLSLLTPALSWFGFVIGLVDVHGGVLFC